VTRFLVSKCSESVTTLVLVAILIFLAVRLTPGDPATLLLPRAASAEQKAALRESWGLDDALPTQFRRYVGNIVRLDFGESLKYREPVRDVVLDRLPATLRLAVVAILLSLLISVPLGVLAALRPGSALDTAISVGTLLVQSVPSFWLGVQLIIVFSLKLGWLPSSGSEGTKHIILPAVTLSADVTALFTRLVRTEMQSALRQDYIRTAHGKGLPKRVVVGLHALRNAANPLITVLGLRFGTLLSGAVITETIFAWPGIGRLAIDSVAARDYPLIQGIVLTTAAIFLGVHLAIDALYALLDPRVRKAGR
jgi:peptide/nickel transport system permease protein/oligopeptide transport system permease protein